MARDRAAEPKRRLITGALALAVSLFLQERHEFPDGKDPVEPDSVILFVSPFDHTRSGSKAGKADNDVRADAEIRVRLHANATLRYIERAGPVHVGILA
jgi:hypothetical protein